METADWLNSLLDAVPELRGARDEHLADNDEMLPHVFFGDVTRWAENEVSRGRPSDALSSLLSYLDSSYHEGSAEVKNIVDASFLENAEGTGLTRLLGPRLTQRRCEIRAS